MALTSNQKRGLAGMIWMDPAPTPAQVLKGVTYDGQTGTLQANQLPVSGTVDTTLTIGGSVNVL